MFSDALFNTLCAVSSAGFELLSQCQSLQNVTIHVSHDEEIEDSNPRVPFAEAISLSLHTPPCLTFFRMVVDIQRTEETPLKTIKRANWKSIDLHFSSFRDLDRCEILLRDCRHEGSEHTMSLSEISTSTLSTKDEDLDREVALIKLSLPRLAEKGV